MATTPIYALPYPGEFDPADVPTDLEALARRLDQLAGMFLPGDLKPTAAQVAPAGWLLCDGREVLRDTFRALFEAIGTTHGAGDGSLTFNLPALRGRMVVGAGQGEGLTDRTLGARGGAEAVALAVAEMPHHGHGFSDPGHAHGVTDHLHGVPAGSSPMALWTAPGDIHQGTFNFAVGGVSAAADRALGTDGRSTNISFVAEGGNAPHTNMPPFVAVNWFIKT
jgi:microcystin-dependent protein